jgi:hypothetical protein
VTKRATSTLENNEKKRFVLCGQAKCMRVRAHWRNSVLAMRAEVLGAMTGSPIRALLPTAARWLCDTLTMSIPRLRFHGCSLTAAPVCSLVYESV